jgi:intein/homing endonuclease
VDEVMSVAQITVGEALVQNNRVENHITVNDPALKPYFTTNTFYAEYPENVEQVPRSLLNIPALSTIIHFAVAVGASVEAGQIDATYLHACEEAQAYLKTCKGFESLKCTATVKAQATHTQHYPADREGLLFSGGSDSTSSWIKRRRENPALYMIWGLDVPLAWEGFWQEAKARYLWMNPRIIKTNTEEIYFPGMLSRLGKELIEGYRPTYSFSINALGVCAPLTYLDGVGLLQLSSTYPSRHYLNPRYPWAANRPSFLVNQFWRWGNTRCLEVDHEYSTTEKIIRYIKPYYDQGNPLFLRVCGNQKRLLEAQLKVSNCLNCVPEGTLVYSNSSIKSIEKIDTGELIQGQKNAYQKVNNVFSRHYEGNLIKIKPLYFEGVSFTPEHEILVAIRGGSKECHLDRNLKYEKYHSISHTIWKKSSEIQKGDLIVIPKKQKTKKHVIDFTKYRKNPNHKISSRCLVNGKKIYDENMAELLGWYVAEGHYNPLSTTIEFTLSSKEIKEAERLIYLIKTVFGLKGRIWAKRAESAHSIRVLCGSPVLGRFLHESFGKRAKEKTLPDFVMNSNKRVTSAFLEGYLLGDGCKAINRGQKKRTCASASKTLTKQIQILLMKIGIISGYSETSSSEQIFNNYIIKPRKAYQLHYLNQKRYRKMYLEDEKNFYIPIEKIEIIPFSGKVYNLETDEHIYLLPFVVHNCDKCQRTLGLLAIARIDPRRVGFPVTGVHYARARSDIEKRTWSPTYLRYHWEEVRSLIPKTITEDYGGSKAFLEWLRGYTF